MRVLQVGSGLHSWTGIEKYIIHLTQGLSQRGHDVTVTVSPDTQLAYAMNSSSVEILVRNKLDLRALSAYIRLFRSRQFDLIHTHYNPDFIIVAWAARLVGRTPLVMTRHVALPWARLKAMNFSRLYDRIIPVSEASRRRLLGSGVPDSKMRIAKAGCPPLEISVSRDSIRSSLGMNAGFNVGFFGRLAPEKGLKLLMTAADMLPEGLQIHIFGDGPLKSEVVAAASTRRNVVYHGFRTDVADCMSSADAVVIPSIWEEAFPYSALEAMSLARPIVASDIGGLPELVTNSDNGLLFEPGNPGKLAKAILELAGDRAHATAMGERGREIQRSHYTVAQMAERVEAVYSELI